MKMEVQGTGSLTGRGRGALEVLTSPSLRGAVAVLHSLQAWPHPLSELLALPGENANRHFTRVVTKALARELTKDTVCDAKGTWCSW